MVEHLKQEGTSHSSSDLLKINVKLDDSWTAQVLRQAGETPSGPLAFLLSPEDFAYIFTDLDYRVRNSIGGGRERVMMAVLWEGQSGCGVSDQAFTFQTYCRSHLLIGLSAGGGVL